MSQKQPKIAKLLLLPEELFAFTGSHERLEMNRYRRLAFSFLPFDLGVGKLMAALGIECERRLDEQHRLRQRMALPDSLTASEARHARSACLSRQCVFIKDIDMAREALDQAIVSADYSLRFYQQLQDANTLPEVRAMLAAFVKQKRAECRILEECQLFEDRLEPGEDGSWMPFMDFSTHQAARPALTSHHLR